MAEDSFALYWGKTSDNFNNSELGITYHLFPYHSLEVAFIAEAWLQSSNTVKRIMDNVCLPKESGKDIEAWLLFFIASHDYGKMDLRFQLKVPDVVKILRPNLQKEMWDVSKFEIKNFKHGVEGYKAFLSDFLDADSDCVNEIDMWMASVTGHHGVISRTYDLFSNPEAEDDLVEFDRNARRQWIQVLGDIFLLPHGLSWLSNTPLINQTSQMHIAGLCSIADWIASQNNIFPYRSDWIGASEYWQELHRKYDGKKILEQCGLLKTSEMYVGLEKLLSTGEAPRQVQCLVPKLQICNGLTIVEAPTGCGKTEMALAYAWMLISAGEVDSVILAMPTQATANAMFERAKAFANRIFAEDGANLVLAHGKSLYNHSFQTLCEHKMLDGKIADDGGIDCSEWLASSKKRSFLGQIGICTIDQILLSVLPVKHNFVRTFGLGKSVLIVDEVHAYDTYMYGLLEEVLRRQALSGGAAILLSATLPSSLKYNLLKSWGVIESANCQVYPLITQAAVEGKIEFLQLGKGDEPPKRVIKVNVRKTADETDLVGLLVDIRSAVEKGALVGLIFNTVDRVQQIANLLLEQFGLHQDIVDVFHSRFSFFDRQKIEEEIIKLYGRNSERKKGRVLVATQVVEQSLDLDFDWMVSEICPVDLLFQRLGRLHRHMRNNRADGFRCPSIDVCIPGMLDYGATEYIYGDSRLLWRTEQLLKESKGEIVFPDVYRPWIEKVYQEEDWGIEPAQIVKKHSEFVETQMGNKMSAKQMINSGQNPIADSDSNAMRLTRLGDMQLQVLLLKDNGEYLHSNEVFIEDNSFLRHERMDMSSVAVSANWASLFTEKDEESGMRILRLSKGDDKSFFALSTGNQWISYSKKFGLQKN